MKKPITAVPAAGAPTAGATAASSAPVPKPDLGLSERRKAVRTLPVPDAVESERDTDWALFQALVDPPNLPKK